MAGSRDPAVEEHTCPCCNGCKCAGPCERSCFETRENGASTEGDAVEQSGCTEMHASGAIEEDKAAEKSVVVEESISISTKTSLAIDIQTGIREHPCVGRYQIVPTSSQGNWCGVYALGISTFWQLGIEMTVEQFRYIYFRHAPMRAFMTQKGYDNVNNFFDDQLAMVLRLWGRIEGLDPNLQLGVVLEDAECAYIIGGDDKFLLVSSEEEMEAERGFTTVWIHNDNAQALAGGGMNHYSGITLLDRRVEQVSGSEEAGANEEDKDAEMERETEGEDSDEDSSTLPRKESSAKEDSDAEMKGDEMGQETEEENLGEDSSMPSEEKSTDEGSDADMEDAGWMWQEADEGEFTEDSSRESSCDPAEERESEEEDPQNKKMVFTFEKGQLLYDTTDSEVD